MSEGTVTMELDDAALDELMNDISCSLEHDVDPFSLFIGDNIDEARLAIPAQTANRLRCGDGDRCLRLFGLSPGSPACGVDRDASTGASSRRARR